VTSVFKIRKNSRILRIF